MQKQVNYPEINYCVEEEEGREVCYTESLAMKYYYEDQLAELLGWKFLAQYRVD